MAFRYDIGSMRPPERLPDGSLRADGRLTRSGVFDYRNTDGTLRREFRPDGEVFKPDSLRTFADVAVTDDHPSAMVSAANRREIAVGHVSGEPRRDGDHVAATLVLTDEATIAKVLAGKVELSCGYECDLDPTPGVTPDGERYDAVQTNIRGNHVAIVSAARAGRSARLRVDAAEQVDPQELTPMPEIKTDATDLAAALATAVTRADAAEAALATATAAHETALAEQRARADAAERDLAAERAARKDAADTERARMRARLQLEASAAKFLGGDASVEGLTDRQIHVAVVRKLDGAEIPDTEHDAYARAAYEFATKRADAADAAVDGLRVVVEAGRQDAGASEAEKARAEMLDRNANAHKTAK